MDIRDSQRIKQICDNTEKMADAFTRIADALERLIKPKESEIPNYCATCNHKDTPFEELPCYQCEKYIEYEPKIEPHIDDLIKQADSLIEFEKELLKTEPLDKDTNVHCIEADRMWTPKTEPQTDYERGRQDAWDIAQKVFDSTVTLYEAEDVAKQIAKTESQTDCP